MVIRELVSVMVLSLGLSVIDMVLLLIRILCSIP
jgi:hypothetical protein